MQKTRNNPINRKYCRICQKIEFGKNAKIFDFPRNFIVFVTLTAATSEYTPYFSKRA